MLDYIKHGLSRYRWRLRSLFETETSTHRETDGDRFDDENETDGNTSDGEGETPDPRLTAFLATDRETEFEQVRQDAITSLKKTESIAIWFQAIGNGTSLEPETDDPIERVNPHNTLYLSGFHDELSHPEIVQAAVELFAHHVGVSTEIPGSPQAQTHRPIEDHGREVLRDVLDLSTMEARQFAAECDVEDLSTVLKPRSFDDQRNHALTILEDRHDELSAFWIQVMTMDYIASVSPSAGPVPDTDLIGAPSIEYFQAWPPQRQIGRPFLGELTMESIIQHQFVTAQIAEQSLDSIKEQSLYLGVENGYLTDTVA